MAKVDYLDNGMMVFKPIDIDRIDDWMFPDDAPSSTVGRRAITTGHGAFDDEPGYCIVCAAGTEPRSHAFWYDACVTCGHERVVWRRCEECGHQTLFGASVILDRGWHTGNEVGNPAWPVGVTDDDEPPAVNMRKN